MKVKSRAPLRVGLAGGGTDLETYYSQYGGLILNCTIDKYANVEIEENCNNFTKISMLDMDDFIEIHENNLFYDKKNNFCLAIAVYKYFIETFNTKYINLDIKTYVDAPAGSGLGTSSTLVVALVSAFSNFYNIPLGEYEIAEAPETHGERGRLGIGWAYLNGQFIEPPDPNPPVQQQQLTGTTPSVIA